ncbi:MAG: hypothetical protein WAW91_00340 [Candidatus Nanoperiomorbaceae bacterium]
MSICVNLQFNHIHYIAKTVSLRILPANRQIFRADVLLKLFVVRH